MGKAKRNRKRRRREQARRDQDPELSLLAEAIQGIDTPDQFSRLISERPALIGDQMLSHLEEVSRVPNFESSVGLFLNLVRGAREDPRVAWQDFQHALADAEERGEHLGDAQREIESLIAEREYDQAIELAEKALPHAIELGLGLLVGLLHEHLATAYRLTSSGDPGDNIDTAIDHVEASIPASIDVDEHVSRQMNLAVLVASRPHGDPAENFEAGIEILRDALDSLDGSTPGDLRATVQMNLAHNLHIRERGERAENLREARDLCLATLEWRSLKRNSEDWAFSKINLGAIYDDLAQIGEADLADAEAALQEVIDAELQIEAKWLVGVARSSLGGLHRREAEKQAEADDRAVVGPGEPPPPSSAERRHLDAARRNLQAALGLLVPDEHSDYRGRTLCDLGSVQEANGDRAAAIDSYRAALRLLRPSTMPRQCAEAGWSLGNLLAQRELWSEAAEAFSIAVSAAEFGFHARLETPDRQGEAQWAGNLARWAAFALAKAGDSDAAVLVLESGRTRELRRRTGIGADEARLSEMPPEARSDYREALEQLSASSLGPSSDAAGRRLQEVLTGIRELPGFRDFAKGARWPEVRAAVQPHRPLVYVNPAPWGTVLLAVVESDGEVRPIARFLEPTSHDVLMALMFGEMQDLSQPMSYLAGTGDDEEASARFRRGLEYVIRALGEWIAEPLAGYLREVGATQATLILCGPIAQAPLHAAAWRQGSTTNCLVDEFVVSYAPSATLQGVCFRRTGERQGREATLVALGNPDLGDPRWDLPGSEAEVEEIGRQFDPGRIFSATREDASVAFLADYVVGATHLHLACHAQGGLFDPNEAAIALADGWFPALDIGGGGLETRLTVISACEAAVADIAKLPDEVFSLSTAFLSAGSAGVIATLWSIDDLATALLMTRFYEDMLGNDHPPAEALRLAQLWLRDLSEEDESAFLTAHPALESEFARRADESHRPGTRRRTSSTASAEPTRPYAHPYFWAPFIAVGA